MPHFVSLPVSDIITAVESIYNHITHTTVRSSSAVSDIITAVELIYNQQQESDNRMIFGNWNQETGIYTFNNGFCLNFDVKYEIETNSEGYVKSYRLILDCKNEAWAYVMYEMFDWALGSIQLIGTASVKITEVSGDIVTIDVTALAEDISIDEVGRRLMLVDRLYAHPWIIFCFF